MGLSSTELYSRIALHYLDRIEHETGTIYVDQDVLPNCLLAFHELSAAQSTSDAIYRVLSQLLKTLFSTLLTARRMDDLMSWCNICLHACLDRQDDPSWVYLLRTEVYSALGQWDSAEADIDSIAALNHESATEIHAQTLYARGRLQLNRSDYRKALPNLRQAQQLFAQIGDTQHSIQAEAELAAYEMNAGHLLKALAAYKSIAAMRCELSPSHPANYDHTLLMLGVIYRKLGRYDLAEQNLNNLRAIAQSTGMKNTMATASHHLTWVYISQGRLNEAEPLCRDVLADYAAMSDPRGMGDAYEQWGMIQFLNGDTVSAVDSLKKSLVLRQTIGNRQGMASSLRRLAYVHLASGQFGCGATYVRQCTGLYRQIGVMSAARVGKLTVEFIDALRTFMLRTVRQ